MINSNKPKNVLRLPKISPLNQDYLLWNEYSSQGKLKTLQPKRSDLLKQNSAPKDLKNSTIYLEFPIGRKRPIMESPCELQIDKLTEDAMFANRAICSMYRKDVRARMYKYDEQRMNFMTQRSNNNQIPQPTVLRQFLQKQLKRKMEQNKKQQKTVKYPLINKNEQRYEYLTSWDYNKESLEQSNDSLLESMVQKSINKNKRKHILQ